MRLLLLIVILICLKSCKTLDLDTNKSIIVVGNGKSLKGSKKGRYIDTFDCVVRFNCYDSKCCIEDVGEKCSILVSNPYHLRCAIQKKSNSVLVFNHGNSLKGRLLQLLYLLKRNIYIENNMPNLCNKKCSNGIHMINYLLHRGCKNISICGFDHSVHHFDGYVWNKGVPHDFKNEKEMIDKYVKQGKIKRL